MLIRSQDKKDLINLDKTYRIGVVPCYGDNNKWLILAENGFSLGTYSTEAKAIKVLDAIENAYTMANSQFDNGDAYWQSIREANQVLQMPSDEEVEDTK